MYGIFETLLQKYGVTAYRVAKETGISQTTFSNWKSGRSTPKTDALQKIADYFGVTIDYLTTGNEVNKEKETSLTAKSDRDIAEKLDAILFDIDDIDENPLYYKGEKIDEKSLAILEQALVSAMKQVDIMREKGNKK